jgi:hypothetical protein
VSQNSFGFLLAFLHANIISTKMTYHTFSKLFSFMKNIFWSVTFGDNSADKSLDKKGAGRKPVSRLNTVDT